MRRAGIDVVITNPWDLQSDDSLKSFEAFQIYRDMGPSRTIEAVSTRCSKSASLLLRWSAAHRWVERARAFDAEASKIASAKSLNDHAEVRARQAEHGRLLQEKGAARIKDLEPGALAPPEAVKAIVDGAKLERDALGIGTRVEITGKNGGAIEVDDKRDPEQVAGRVAEIFDMAKYRKAKTG